MKVTNRQILPIQEVRDFVTNIDEGDLSENYVSGVRGFRYDRSGIIGERDYGTQHYYANYPFERILGGCNLYLPNENKSYDVIFGIGQRDTAARIAIGDPDNGTWDELTKCYTARIYNGVSANDLTFTVNYFSDIYTGQLAPAVVNVLVDYIAYNPRNGKTAIVSASSSATTFGVITVSVRKYVGSSLLDWRQGDVINFYRTIGAYNAITNNGLPYIGEDPHLYWMPLDAQQKTTLFWGKSNNAKDALRPLQIRKGKRFVEAPVESGLMVLDPIYYVPKFGHKRRSILQTVIDSSIAGDPSTPEELCLLLGYQFTGTTYASKFQEQDGWYIDNAMTMTSFNSEGTATAPKTTATVSANGVVIGEGVWIKTALNDAASTAGKKTHVRTIICPLYSGKDGLIYQIGDPIYQGFFAPVNDAYKVNVTHTVGIDFSKFARNIKGFRVYQANYDLATTASLGEWLDDASEYIKYGDILLPEPIWTLTPSDDYTYRRDVTQLTQATYDEALASANTNLLADLGHVPVKTRSVLKPRYGVRLSREQGSFVVVDGDDQTAYVSNYGGDGQHMDDVFVDDSSDNQNRTIKIVLQGRGKVLGLQSKNNLIHIVRGTEMEVCSLSGSAEMFQCDCVSSRSIVAIGEPDAPKAFAWSGRGAIYIAPTDGGSYQVLNPKWKNLYDGRVRANNNNIKIQDINKEAIVAGYDPLYNEAWFKMVELNDSGTAEHVVYRYNFDAEKWNIRSFDVDTSAFDIARLQGLKYITRRHNGELVLGFTNGLLRYPYLSNTNLMYQDFVSRFNVTANKGIETWLKMNLGGFYGLKVLSTILDFEIDHEGNSTDTDGTFTVEIFTDGETTAYDTTTITVDDNPVEHKVARKGAVSKAQIKISIPETQEINCKDLTISRCEIGYVKHEKLGN